MELDKIKSKTTWSDAAASLNENFARILKGIRDGIPTIETPVVDYMSDASEDGVQNKVIKKYVDDSKASLASDIKSNPSNYVKLKTVNGTSLYGTGNIVIQGGSGSGAAKLEELNDVSITLPENWHLLAYDESTGYWVNKAFPAATSSMLGGIKVGASSSYQSGSYHRIPLALDTSSRAYVTLTNAAVKNALGYTPFSSSSFTKGNIQSTLEIKDWALADNPPLTKAELSKVATSGSYNDLSNRPTIPAEQVNADWNATSGKAQILNKPTIPAAVTESTVRGWGFGTYSKPSGGIPKTDLASTVQDSLDKADDALQDADIKTFTLKVNGDEAGTYNPLDSTDKTINIPNVASATELLMHKSADNPHGITAEKLGVQGIIDDTLADWGGNENISKVGTVTTGEWKGTPIANAYLANSSVKIAGKVAVLGGQITKEEMQSALGLKALAYKDELKFSEIKERPTTIGGYGITDAYTMGDADGRFVQVGDSIHIPSGKSLRIGNATIEWDASSGMLKIDKGVYSLGGITAGGVGKGSLAVSVNLSYFLQTATLTDAQVAKAGLTDEVISNLLDGAYTKVVYVNENGHKEIWNYSANSFEGGIAIYFSHGDGFDVLSGISLIRDNNKWKSIFGEI